MKCIIIGAGGHGRVVLETLQLARQYEPVGFIDADASLAGQYISGVPVLGQANQLPKLRQQMIRYAIVAIGNNRARRSYADELRKHGFELISAIHPSACVSPSANIEPGVLIAAGAIVSAATHVRELAIINTGAIVDHECDIGAGAHICPAAALAGRVNVGECAFVGLGAKVLPCLSIGSEATIGAGAVVLRDVPPHTTAVGVPARYLPAARAA